MPSQLHEALLQLFRNRPELAPELLRDTLHVELPKYSEARVGAAVAIADPELAVLSAMAHGQDDDREKAVRIALAAQLASVNLDEDRSKLYCDLILNSLHEVARQALLTMNPANYEYQSDFARRYVAQGIEEGIERGMEKGIERGKLQGRADLVIRLLGVRFGAISEDIKLRIAAASLTELDAIGERLLSAKTLQEALGQ